jgi:hypothetical protein
VKIFFVFMRYFIRYSSRIVMRQNGKKKDPHYDPPFPRGELILKNGTLIPWTEFLHDCARKIVRGYRESSLEDDLRWFRRKENRNDAAKVLRKAQKVLLRVAPLLRDHPQIPTIVVKDFRRKPDSWVQLNATDYISLGQLDWIAEWLNENKSPTGASPKYAIKEAAADLAEFYRDNLGKPDWEMIAIIILEEFPEAQKRRKKTASHQALWRTGCASSRSDDPAFAVPHCAPRFTS